MVVAVIKTENLDTAGRQRPDREERLQPSEPSAWVKRPCCAHAIAIRVRPSSRNQNDAVSPSSGLRFVEPPRSSEGSHEYWIISRKGAARQVPLVRW